MTEPTHVLFVCLGNICRSPLAEGVFDAVVRERGLDDHYRSDSAGTGAWHVGEPPDPRSTEVARRHGVELEGRARRVGPEDFERFDVVVAMDRSNLRDLERMSGADGARLRLLRDFDPTPGDGEVPDPYYGGPRGFDQVYELVRRSVDGLLEHLEAERSGESGT